MGLFLPPFFAPNHPIFSRVNFSVFSFFTLAAISTKREFWNFFGEVGFLGSDGSGTIWAEPRAAREVMRREFRGRGASEPLEAENCELSVNGRDFSVFSVQKQAGFVQYFSAFSN